VTSGIRIGTPAITTRGMGPSEMEQIASFVMEVLRSKGDPQVIARIKQEVIGLTSRFPLP